MHDSFLEHFKEHLQKCQRQRRSEEIEAIAEKTTHKT